MTDYDELPVDPDEDALPPELAEHPGPFVVEGGQVELVPESSPWATTL